MTPRTWVSVVVLTAVVVLACVGMWRGWAGRRARTADAVPAALPAVPAELGQARTEALEAQYVTTTRAGDWLDRVASDGLGVRGRATVQVFDAGVRVDRVGEPGLFVPAGALRAASTAPGMAGKFVGREGLVVLTWSADPDDERGLDTGLRTRHAADRDLLVAAASALIASTPGSAGRQEPGSAGQEEKP